MKFLHFQRPHAYWYMLAVFFLFSECSYDHHAEGTTSAQDSFWFVKLTSDQTGITFQNTVIEDEARNVLLYEYFYNGGGVAVGDFNNDGLDDVFLTANQQACKLYLNEGDWNFKDVTHEAHVAGRETDWKTGAVSVDVNADGWLDLYVCYSGPHAREQRANQLFINKGADSDGVPVFEEQSGQFGLNDEGFTTHAAFFDYDRDGDLDAILINHNPRRLENLSPALVQQMMATPDPMKGLKLYQNNDGVFRDVTLSSGLRNCVLNFGLGVAVSDINGDGWQDVYVSNDYLAPDYLYINDHGKFTDRTKEMLQHTAQFSMGNNIADINNDGLPDITTLDMLPEDNRRQKLLFAPDNYTVFNLQVEAGLHAQFMRNMLQLNNGDGTFSEIGQLAGISNTDWSWAPLYADFDNDGWKDLYVTNGYLRDFTNMDFLKYMTKYFKKNASTIRKEDMIKVVEQMPSSNVHDYMFRNEGGIKFTDKSMEWGFAEESNGNGVAFSDFDNDGDLDIIVNTINGEPTVYRNDAEKYSGNKSVTLVLRGEGKNTQGIGAKVIAWCDGSIQLYEQRPSQGFQSTVSQSIILGVGQRELVDSVCVIWPTGKEQRISNVKTGGVIKLNERNAEFSERVLVKETTQPMFTELGRVLSFTHQENSVIDFKRQPLLTRSLSYSGPCMAVGDVNGDEIDDLFVGGASGQAGGLFVGSNNGTFKKSIQPDLDVSTVFEDSDAIFFDADSDGDSDLYVCSGGYDLFEPQDKLLQDRIYFNDGGILKGREHALPEMLVSTSCVRSADINQDGCLDLFVGGRVIPGRYPEVPRSYLLLNDGEGNFKDATSTISEALKFPGLVTDAQWCDMNADGWPDLVTVGEWLPIQVWINEKGKLVEKTQDYFTSEDRGWWNRLVVADLNADNRPDLIAGNYGLNSQCRASDKEPVELYFKDYDANGSVDPILCVYIQGKSYPYISRDELLDQLAFMRKRFTDYESYSNAQLADIFTAEELKGSEHWLANTLETKMFLSTSSGKFSDTPLPQEVQYSPVHAILVHDFNGDSKPDILMAGNERNGRLRFGWHDANYGQLLLQDVDGNFNITSSDLKLTGDIRSLHINGNTVFVGVNNMPVRVFGFSGK